VAPATVTADVTAGVIGAGPRGGRVAFMELRLSPEPPARWIEEPRLSILTDGGDGGFWSSDAHTDTAQNFDDYVTAFAPPGVLCVLRRNEDQPEPSGFLFPTGVGDGWYGTYLGRAADGRVVSVVSYGGLVPWALSGLPGTPPAEILQATRDRGFPTPPPSS
jgi:hypothetical protein